MCHIVSEVVMCVSAAHVTESGSRGDYGFVEPQSVELATCVSVDIDQQILSA